MKILLVEDNAGDARLIQAYLDEAGLAMPALTQADRLAEGIRRVGESDFDVVLLDLSLPDASGLETVAKMHEAAATRPIVVLTGLNDGAVARAALRRGAQDYLIKGQIDSALLVRAIHYAIERKQAETALRESEERFRALYASIIDAVLVHRVGSRGRPGLIIEANDAACRLLGYSRAELVTKSVPDLAIPVPGPDPWSVVPHLQREGDALFELVFRAKDGRFAFTEVHAGSLRHGGEEAVIYVIRDVTERNRAEAEIAKKNAELARLDALKNQFLGMAAHDLRNPLAVVTACSDFLLNPDSASLNSAMRTDFLRRIKANGEFMLKLINDLLDVAKIESGRLDLDLVAADLGGLIEENLAVNRMLAEKRGIQLHFAPEGGLPQLRFDRAKVEQVLNNLCSNALKFSAPGTTVTVRTARADGSVVVSVQDQGPGIPAEELDKLFNPFFRTTVRSTGDEKSTGLGLAISRKIVEGHGGRIWAGSEVGKGTTFSFSLPSTNDERSTTDDERETSRL